MQKVGYSTMQLVPAAGLGEGVSAAAGDATRRGFGADLGLDGGRSLGRGVMLAFTRSWRVPPRGAR